MMIRKMVAIGLFILLCTGCPKDDDGNSDSAPPEEDYTLNIKASGNGTTGTLRPAPMTIPPERA